MLKRLYFLVAFFSFVNSSMLFADFGGDDYHPGNLNWPVYLHPEEQCEEVVAWMKDNVNSICENLSGYEDSLENIGLNFHELTTAVQGTSDYQNDVGDIRMQLRTINENFDYNKQYILNYFGKSNNIVTNLYDRLDQINCSECMIDDSSGGTNSNSNCCDFTGLYTRLDELIRIQSQIKSYVERLQNIDQNLQYTAFLVEHGFQDVTNLLISTGVQANFYPTYYYYTYDYEEGGEWLLDFTYIPLQQKLHIADMIESIMFNNALGLGSINNFLADRQDGYFLTSLESPSPLFRFDQQSQYTDYYTYLTNYYFGIVRGDEDIPADHKQNWFTRIETLLAALVFNDSTTTNTVDTSAGETEREQLADTVETASEGASTFNQDFKSASQSITQLYRSYFTIFETAAMPSHVVLMRLSSNEGEDIEVAFQSDALGILVEGCRVVTTFAWASVGILLLYKFLVWAGRCIVVTCQFIYRVISSVFKS